MPRGAGSRRTCRLPHSLPFLAQEQAQAQAREQGQGQQQCTIWTFGAVARASAGYMEDEDITVEGHVPHLCQLYNPSIVADLEVEEDVTQEMANDLQGLLRFATGNAQLVLTLRNLRVVVQRWRTGEFHQQMGAPPGAPALVACCASFVHA